MPFALLVPLQPATQATLGASMPFVSAMTMKDDRATAFVCRDFACRQPVTTASALSDQLTAR